MAASEVLYQRERTEEHDGHKTIPRGKFSSKVGCYTCLLASNGTRSLTVVKQITSRHLRGNARQSSYSRTRGTRTRMTCVYSAVLLS